MDLSFDNELLKVAYKKATLIIDKNKIGLLKEHTLHRTVKFYLEPDESFHEIKINNMFADILKDNHIYEVQTKSFNLLRDKLKEFLPSHNVTICFPIAQNKIIRLYDKCGSLVKESKSNRHLNVFELLIESYKISSFLNNSNLSFMVLMMDMIEERTIDETPRWHSKGYNRINQIPTKINRVLLFNSKDDFINLLYEYELKNEFTSKEFATVTKSLKTKSSTILNVLLKIRAVERIGKNKNSYIYKISNNI